MRHNLKLPDLPLLSLQSGVIPPALITPASFAGLQGWWKADSFSLADDTFIGGTGLEWIDQANAFDGTQPGADAQFKPKFRTNIFGSAPAIEFNFNAFNPQSHLALAGSEDGGINLTGDFTIIAVLKAGTPSSGSLGGPILGNAYTSNHTSVGCFAQFESPSGCRLFLNGGTTDVFSSDFSTNGPWMVSIIRSGLNLEYRRNANASFSSTHVLSQVDTLKLNYMAAINGSGIAVRFSGYIGELCVYNAALLGQNCNDLYNQYFQSKFSL